MEKTLKKSNKEKNLPVPAFKYCCKGWRQAITRCIGEKKRAAQLRYVLEALQAAR